MELAKIISFDSPDRRGKTTQAKLLTEYLNSISFEKSIYIKIPYDDGITFKLIYKMLNNGLAKSISTIFQLIQYVNKLAFQTFVLPKLRRQYDYIILDRWSLSALAYGNATGVNNWVSMKMYNSLIKPDKTIILDGRPLIGTLGDSYENDSELQESVRSFYENWGNNNPTTTKLINANQPIQSVTSEIISSLWDKKESK